jgi:outer membrane receptor protein involved in Fe transport
VADFRPRARGTSIQGLGENEMQRIVRIALAAAILSLIFTAGLSAQQLATLRVTAEDSTGGALPGINITLKNKQTGVARTATTGEFGLAVMAGLSPGSYELTAVGKSFNARTMAVDLSVGQVASLTVTLGVATQEQKIEVSDTAQGIDVEKTEVSQVIDSRKIQDLPIQGREFIDFALLTPSVSIGRSTAIGAQSPFTETVVKLSFAGLRESHTSLLTLDGLDYTTSISGVQRLTPSQDWVDEFRVVTSAYTVDTGRSLGSVVNTVTKSGSNVLHGSVYEYFRNNKLDANNLLSAPGFNTLRQNQFGATLGGPVIKQKNFFFGGYEGQRRAESPVYSSFILNNINGPVSINSQKLKLGLTAENLSSFLQVDDYDKFFLKDSHSFNSNNSMNVAYIFTDDRKLRARGASPGEGLPSSFRNNPIRDQTIYANFLQLPSPSWTLDTGLQYGRRNFRLDPVGAGFEPAISISNLLSSGGFVGSVRFYIEQRFQVVENVTHTMGKHVLKFGGEAQNVAQNYQVPIFSPGVAIFSPPSFFGNPGNGFTPTPLLFNFLEPKQFFGVQIPNRNPNFPAGLFAGPSQSAFDQNTTLDHSHQLYGFYVQDQWKVLPNFTITAGLRYDIEKLPSASDTKTVGAFHPTKYNNFQPRLNFAYSFNHGKGVVRGGYGIFVSPFIFSDVLVSWIGGSEFGYLNNPLVPQLANNHSNLIGLGASGVVGVIPPLPPPVSPANAFANFTATGAYPAPGTLIQFPLGYAQRDFNNPFAQQASLQVEHQFGKDLFVSVEYLYSHATRLPVYLSINGVPAGTSATGRLLLAPADFGYGFALMVAPVGFSIYHGGTLSVRKTFAHHYSLLTNYVYSKSLDISTTINLPNVPQNYLHIRQDKAISDNDNRHRFTAALQAESPESWWKPLQDMKGSIVLSAASPRYSTINVGFDTNGDNFPFSDRVGTVGRNTYRGQRYVNMDLRIQKAFPITQKLKGQFSAEAFNIFNIVNVQDIDHVYAAPDFLGPIPKQFGDGITSPVPGTTFGTPKFVAPARQIQFSLRLLF